MLAALILQSLSFFTNTESTADPTLFNIVLQSSAPVPRDYPVRVSAGKSTVNDKPANLTLVAEHPIVLMKGRTRVDVPLRLARPLQDALITCVVKLRVGDHSVSGWIYRYLPVRGAALASQLDQLRRRFVGKNVWIYGGDVKDSALPNGSVRFAGETALKVSEVRHNGTQFEMRFVAAPVLPIGVRDEHRGFYPTAGSPAPPTSYFVSAPSKIALYETVSLTPPPRGIAAAMRDFPVDSVKTQIETLWKLGPPEPVEPWRSIFARETWHYSIAAPFTYVLKFRNGKLVRRTLDGELP